MVKVSQESAAGYGLYAECAVGMKGWQDYLFLLRCRVQHLSSKNVLKSKSRVISYPQWAIICIYLHFLRTCHVVRLMEYLGTVVLH